ncbi:hypothetical protein [Acetatifactor muris]|uniref:hypothetical protein n=1 Tax=Acetatifactor muris TaxID=879566 RepID=UPI0023F12481|nr:hypothetical protein [Acetatifactor muris]
MNHNNYEDIIYLPHHVSTTHLHMPIADRAAQFSAFAALTGYEEVIREAGRVTGERIELDEDARMLLDEKLQTLQERMAEQPETVITYFSPDGKKTGGAYVTVRGRVKKIDAYERMLVMTDGTRIAVEEIVQIQDDALI